MHSLGIGRKLPHRFDIGCKPGKAMGGALLAIEQSVEHLVIDRDASAHRRRCVGEQRLDCLPCLPRQRNQLDPGVAALRLVQHDDLPC
jgi:hypothetical protein